MKIHEVEKLLGITKANIRFYEKEGLLTPSRTAGGYRDYSEADVKQLKKIVILRKLGIPVQQIADILDGATPLQEAITANIETLNAEIEKLNGALFLCQQLKSEAAVMLDTERYWHMIHEKEQQGFHFQSLLQDYVKFMEPTLDRYLIHVPEKHDRNPRMIIKYTAFFALGMGIFNAILTGDLFVGLTSQFLSHFILAPLGFLMWCILYIPAYFVSKKHPELGKILKVVITVVVFLAAVIYFAWAVFGSTHT